MNQTTDYVPVNHLAAIARVSPRTVRRALRRYYPDHPRSFRWEISHQRASEVVERIKKERKRNRRNQWTQ